MRSTQHVRVNVHPDADVYPDDHASYYSQSMAQARWTSAR